MTLQALVTRYALFAAIATLANLAAQRLVLMTGEQPVHFLVAVMAGTLVGLVIKYILDKRWIFYDAGAGLRQHGAKFTLYAVMGLVTTVIFWGSESAFWFLWHTDFMRELGAVIGLTIGYVVKYNLDRRFVFRGAALARESRI